MTTTQRTTLKQRLLAECRRMQQLKADHARQAMLAVQESALEDHSAEDVFESFRETCQRQRDLFARQLDEALSGLQVLQRVPEARSPKNQVGLGSVVITNTQRFYVSLSLGEIRVDDTAYFALSAFSPLFQAMAPHHPGDTFQFRGQTYRIQEIF
ncbi:hypothetical protein [Hymenobacter weizhouensis]|uniref:hypothetical protein n=1 Tax=Hymenobacter sp. YIM 151500-1 TaxID=2987689 RepID=UPI002226EAFC|nr:hypothetical protein [Hymenobacter sp. YIM 151500-1]UYZ64220.1 hypothetical protein OIS53_05075 [Hymenobacter sp. YIM 151500-1]